jgi:hypothetical protein
MLRYHLSEWRGDGGGDGGASVVLSADRGGLELVARGSWLVARGDAVITLFGFVGE